MDGRVVVAAMFGEEKLFSGTEPDQGTATRFGASRTDASVYSGRRELKDASRIGITGLEGEMKGLACLDRLIANKCENWWVVVSRKRRWRHASSLSRKLNGRDTVGGHEISDVRPVHRIVRDMLRIRVSGL